MKATFENSVDVLVKAYINNTLEHLNCHACAVGNLIASANNYKFIPLIKGGNRMLQTIVWDVTNGDYARGGYWYDAIKFNEVYSKSAQEIRSCGYSSDELLKIEEAFESVAPAFGSDKDEAMFDGLMLVVDVLAEIHNVDLTAKESAKKLFVKP